MYIKEEWTPDRNLFPFRMAYQGQSDTVIYSKPHWHNFLEIMYVLEGEIDITIGNQEYVIQKGDAVFLGANTIHSSYKSNNTRGIQYVMYFYNELLAGLENGLAESNYVNTFINTFGAGYSYNIIRKDENSGLLLETIQNIFYEYRYQKKGYELVIKGELLKIIAFLIRYDYIKDFNENNSYHQMNIIGEALKYIEKNYHTDINLKELASYMNVSYFYFSKLFKTVTGKNYKEYIDFVRVTEAEKLMMMSSKPIAEIAELVGVTNQSCFNRIYKRVRGMSPREFKSTLERT